MLGNLMEYSVAGLILYVLVGFVLLGVATMLGASERIKQRISHASASVTALMLGIYGAVF
ncbi:MAG TPA: hypothetical protein PLF22_12705 [Pseudomonadales bacterium]|nr:hypothetical protein [Pseudomonadales bacterium]